MNDTPRKRRIPIAGMFMGAAVAVVFSPVTFQLATWFQVVELPVDRHDTAIRAMELGYKCMYAWVALLVLCPIVMLGLLVFRRVRRYALIPLIMIPILLATYPIGYYKMRHIRDSGLSRITFNAQPLLAAIEQYKADQGVWPPNLDVLKPQYIEEIPYTGAPGYPKFEYDLATEDTPFHEYQLSVKTPAGFTNHDRLIYWPEMRYPLDIKGATVEPLNDWAYMRRQ